MKAGDGYDLAGFDVFDTLLVRIVSSPRAAFLLMGNLEEVRTITGCSPEAFARVRCQAETHSRRGRPETTHDAVYEDVRRALALGEEQAERLARIELDVERRLIRPAPGVASRLAGAPAPRRVAISDMYLPGQAVTALLDEAGLGEFLDAVYVSCDHGATKRSGALFDIVLTKEGVTPSRFVHTGDNAESDVVSPRRLGAAAVHAPEAHLSRYERIWDAHGATTGGLSAVFGGAARLARLRMAPADERERAIVEVATGAAAPALVAFVLWTLRGAERRGIRRLYFLARDGELPLHLARNLAPRMGLDIDLRYLHGSRRLLHQATILEGDPRDAVWAWNAFHRPTLAKALRRFGLAEAQAVDHLRRLGAGELADRPVEPEHLRRLLEDTTLREAIRAEAPARRDRMERYLVQEGLGDGTPYGIVDTGWTGRTIESLVASSAAPPVGVYFFGVRKRDFGWHRPDLISGYLFDEVAGTGFADYVPEGRAPAVIETFTVTDEGITVDLEDDGHGGVRPVVASPHNPVLAQWPWWATYRAAVDAFVEALPVEDADLLALGADLRTPTAEVLSSFWEHPTPAEVEAWGSFVFEDDLLGESHNTLVQPYHVADVLARVVSRRPVRPRVWHAGSAAASPLPARLAVGAWWSAKAARRGLVPERARALVRHYRVSRAVRARD